ATAKSIATYCWKKDAYCYQEFIDRQSRKGKLGGLKSNSSNGGVARSNLYNEKRALAFNLKEQGLKLGEIALTLDVTTRTIRNWLNKIDLNH
ncbi:helix-turn-helix domain-containing protein, partial [Acinetobacter sichuanensis]